jgi:hypothetical protein
MRQMYMAAVVPMSPARVQSVTTFVLQSEAKLQSMSKRLREHSIESYNQIVQPCAVPPSQSYISWFLLQGSAFTSPFEVVYKEGEAQLEPEKDSRISDRPSLAVLPWQNLEKLVV